MLQAAFVFALIGVAFFGAYSGIGTVEQAGHQPPQPGSQGKSHPSAFWHWLTEDAAGFFTLALCFITGWLAYVTRGLYVATSQLAADSKEASAKSLAASTRATKTLTRIERAYLTGGGDIVNRGGRKCFRVDVANYGKTAAFLTHYDVRFASLDEVQAGQREVCPRYPFDDRIPPDNKTRVIDYVLIDPPDAEIIYGAFWYTDWRKKVRRFRFILRVGPSGRTRPDVVDVHDSYREWD
jgi:hypothetical protein